MCTASAHAHYSMVLINWNSPEQSSQKTRNGSTTWNGLCVLSPFTQLYFHRNTITVGIFYALPAFQLVLSEQQVSYWWQSCECHVIIMWQWSLSVVGSEGGTTYCNNHVYVTWFTVWQLCNKILHVSLSNGSTINIMWLWCNNNVMICADPLCEWERGSVLLQLQVCSTCRHSQVCMCSSSLWHQERH